MKKAEIEIEVSDPQVIISTLKPEIEEEISRIRIEMTARPGAIKILIEAEDTSALRAALNSHLRLIDLAMKINEEI